MVSRHCAYLRRWGLEILGLLPGRTVRGFSRSTNRLTASNNLIRLRGNGKMVPPPIEYSSSATLRLPLEVGRQTFSVMAYHFSVKKVGGRTHYAAKGEGALGRAAIWAYLHRPYARMQLDREGRLGRPTHRPLQPLVHSAISLCSALRH